MKRLWILTILASALMEGVFASEPVSRHRVVFEFVNVGQEQMEAVLNNVENTIKALGPGTEVELVAHGPGLGLLMKTNAPHSERLQRLMGQKVQFAACENTLRRKNVVREQLFTGVTTVPSGVAEVVRKQEAGWAYIKSGH